MTVISPKLVNIDLYQSQDFFKLESRAADTYLTRGEIQGNSVLSTIWIKSIDPGATLKVNFYDTTTGRNDGERFDLEGHELLSAAGHSRIIVTQIHNTLNCEAIVTGGNVEFSVYVTVVADFASNLDAALIKDGDTFVSDTNLAMPIACLDEVSGELFFLRCKDGALSVSEAGDEFHLWNRDDTDPGSFVDLLTFTVPAGISRRIKTAGVSCAFPGVWELLIDGNIVASGQTTESISDSSRKIDPKKSADSGLEVKLRFRQCANTPIVDVDGFIDALDVEV